MSKQLFRPSRDELEALRSVATQNGKVSEKEWAARNCELNANFLRGDPARYRSFGPYWWALKEEMLKHDITDFGDFIDREGLELCKYDTPFHTLLAAWMYSENAIDMGLMYSNEHLVAYLPEEGGQENDVHPFILADEDMELLALQKNFK